MGGSTEPHAGGRRVINVWDSFERFGRFEEDQVRPLEQPAGPAIPDARVLEVDDEMADDGRPPALAPLSGPPTVDELEVAGTRAGRPAARR